MKTKLVTLLLGGLFAAAATVQAQVDIYITGATAFRANAYRSIRLLYGANLTSQNPADPASGANQVTWSGTIPGMFGAQVVTIRASYSGSVAGIQALTANTSQNYLSSATAGDTTIVSHQADVAFSDVFQSTTAFQTPALVDNRVGVLPFAYVRSVAGSASVTNLTYQQLQVMLPNGYTLLSQFSGNTADDGTSVYLLQRDIGSGTRLTAERDSLYFGTPTIMAPNASCVWTNWAGSSPGFASGSGIVAVLNGTCGPAVGYLGLSDANAVVGGANIIRYNGYLPYNGTAGSPDFAPIRKGLYSFWSYEHLFNRSGAPANIVTFVAGLTSGIDTDLATSTSAVQLSTMRVLRNADGGPITP